MKTCVFFLIITTRFCTCWSAFAGGEELIEADFYVGSAGSDANRGSMDRPFATLGRARNAVRELIKNGLKKDVLVLVRAGTYELAEALKDRLMALSHQH